MKLAPSVQAYNKGTGAVLSHPTETSDSPVEPEIYIRPRFRAVFSSSILAAHCGGTLRQHVHGTRTSPASLDNVRRTSVDVDRARWDVERAVWAVEAQWCGGWKVLQGERRFQVVPHRCSLPGDAVLHREQHVIPRRSQFGSGRGGHNHRERHVELQHSLPSAYECVTNGALCNLNWNAPCRAAGEA